MNSKKPRHYCYRVDNLKNGKYYIGKRSCFGDPEDDPYMGSGKNIRRAIKHYGLENFKKTILAEFDTEEDAYLCEAELVTKDTLLDPMCYNICLGGIGGQRGTVYLNKNGEMTRVMPELVGKFLAEGWSLGWSEAMREAHLHRVVSEETRKKISDIHKKMHEFRAGFTSGKIKVSNEHSNRTLYVFSKDLQKYLKQGWRLGNLDQTNLKKAQRRVGEITVTDGISEKHIKAEDLEKYLTKGWHRGLSEISKKKKSEASKGKKMSEEACRKMSEARRGKPSPSKGSVYVKKDGKKKRIFPEDLKKYLELGWIR